MKGAVSNLFNRVPTSEDVLLVVGISPFTSGSVNSNLCRAAVCWTWLHVMLLNSELFRVKCGCDGCLGYGMG
jgi:hypothetical protein